VSITSVLSAADLRRGDSVRTAITLIRSAVFAVAGVFALLVVSPASAREAPAGFSDLAEKLLPAVVNIATTQAIPPSASPSVQKTCATLPLVAPIERRMPISRRRSSTLIASALNRPIAPTRAMITATP